MLVRGRVHCEPVESRPLQPAVSCALEIGPPHDRTEDVPLRTEVPGETARSEALFEALPGTRRTSCAQCAAQAAAAHAPLCLEVVLEAVLAQGRTLPGVLQSAVSQARGELELQQSKARSTCGDPSPSGEDGKQGMNASYFHTCRCGRVFTCPGGGDHVCRECGFVIPCARVCCELGAAE